MPCCPHRPTCGAYAEGVKASRAQVGAARANVQSYRAAVTAAGANTRAAQANVARNVALQGFQNITAPFDGIITARNIDTGALISTTGGPVGDSSSVGGGAAGDDEPGQRRRRQPGRAGAAPGAGSSSSSPSLFSLAQINVLRFYVSVPQAYLGIVGGWAAGAGHGAGRSGAHVSGNYHPDSRGFGPVFPNAGCRSAAEQRRRGAAARHVRAQANIKVPHPFGSVVIPRPGAPDKHAGNAGCCWWIRTRSISRTWASGATLGKVIEVTSGLKAETNGNFQPQRQPDRRRDCQSRPAPAGGPSGRVSNVLQVLAERAA